MIRTARLILRRARASDLAAFHGILTQPAAMRYWSEPEHETLQQTEGWLASMLSPAPNQADDFVVVLDGQVIGKAGAWRLPEVGFLIAPAHWRKGYAAEAMQAVITHLFTGHQMPALTAEADPRNAASITLLTRLGFAETHRAERTMQWRDEWCDSVYFALPRPAE